MSLPADFSSVLSHPLPGARKVVIGVRMVRAFRWIFLAEALILGTALICLSPLLLILGVMMLFEAFGAIVEGIFDGLFEGTRGVLTGEISLTGSGSDDAPERPGPYARRRPLGWLSSRLYHPGLVMDFTVLNHYGEAMYTGSAPIHVQAEADAMRASVLRAAAQQGITVEEELDLDGAETVRWWLGSLPLMAAPPVEPTEALSEALPEHLTVTRTPRAWTLTHQEVREPGPLWVRILQALIVTIVAPFFILITRDAVTALRDTWGSLLNHPLPHTTLEVRPDGVRYTVQIGERIIEDVHIDGTELVGFTAAEELGLEGDEIIHYGPRLRIHGQRDTVTLPRTFVGEDQSAMLHFLQAATLSLRAAWPDAAPHLGARPIRCPYCATRYPLIAGKGCPSCGGWPEVR